MKPSKPQQRHAAAQQPAEEESVTKDSDAGTQALRQRNQSFGSQPANCIAQTEQRLPRVSRVWCITQDFVKQPRVPKHFLARDAARAAVGQQHQLARADLRPQLKNRRHRAQMVAEVSRAPHQHSSHAGKSMRHCFSPLMIKNQPPRRSSQCLTARGMSAVSGSRSCRGNGRSSV